MRGHRWAVRLRGRGAGALDAVPGAHRLLNELARVEFLDRSLALGAQALLALIPLLMVMGSFLPAAWGSELLTQVREVIGVRDDVAEPLRQAALSSAGMSSEIGLLSLLLCILSASSFSRALQRMYARTWQLATHRGLHALRSSILWLLGWVIMLEVMAALIRSVAGIPLGGLVRVALQLLVNALLWWWTPRLLLEGRVPWMRLLPGALTSALLVVALTQLSSLFMPAYARANLDMFGPLGLVFSVATWLVTFGGALVVGSIIGRMVSDSWPGSSEMRAGPRALT